MSSPLTVADVAASEDQPRCTAGFEDDGAVAAQGEGAPSGALVRGWETCTTKDGSTRCTQHPQMTAMEQREDSHAGAAQWRCSTGRRLDGAACELMAHRRKGIVGCA
eukprot:CAMPEP_0185479216 /NCGR_PEP_ID=MMETSP1366-20130426/5334_1 /TAXON_ID=38817 /ORGANISM="Gephyrocapsa oceanica, Strain RCC1303" /LENGTH=106 /DNA_ID=CAMNT_0028086591 /DNA_START=190 /DNA_END=508 /DNA_ORIENTATION=+